MQLCFQRFGFSEADINDAIKSACDFFNIPMPRMIQDLTNVKDGQTMFVNWDRGSYYDDILCYNIGSRFPDGLQSWPLEHG